MSFRLKKHESVREGVARLACGEIDGALRSLEAGPSGPSAAERVHDARKRLKRLRAVVRLVRGGMPDRIYSRENVTFRDAARPLSVARDARVMVDALDGLLRRFRGDVDPRLFAPLHRQLVARRARVVGEALGERRGTARAAASLRRARKRVGSWRIDSDGFDLVGDGLGDAYRRGRKAMRRALASGRDEDLHEWRKRAKYLRYQVQAVSKASRPTLDALERQLHDLTDALGEDHDLAVLLALASGELAGATDGRGRAELASRAAARRAELQRKAERLGRKIWAEKPSRFVSRLRAYWKAW